jgi:hypothetical protein
MSTETRSAAEVSQSVIPSCSSGRALGIKCAMISWIAPLLAVITLYIGLRFPVLSVFNIVVVGFGVMAMIRSVNHIRKYGACGLGGHIVIGGLLNVAILVLVFIYVYTAGDPLGIRINP